jgi:hypothetical protein
MDLKTPEVAGKEPEAVCPVHQHGCLQLVQTLYRHQAAWDGSVPMPRLDPS